jgi:predicted nucleotidyltransferase
MFTSVLVVPLFGFIFEFIFEKIIELKYAANNLLMRLKEFQINIIKELTHKFFGKNAKVYLFGSRVDDYKKGGDIDIYIETDISEGIFDKKIQMRFELEKKLGQRKIDIVVNNFSTHLPIFDVAKEEGIAL